MRFKGRIEEALANDVEGDERSPMYQFNTELAYYESAGMLGEVEQYIEDNKPEAVNPGPAVDPTPPQPAEPEAPAELDMSKVEAARQSFSELIANGELDFSRTVTVNLTSYDEVHNTEEGVHHEYDLGIPKDTLQQLSSSGDAIEADVEEFSSKLSPEEAAAFDSLLEEGAIKTNLDLSISFARAGEGSTTMMLNENDPNIDISVDQDEKGNKHVSLVADSDAEQQQIESGLRDEGVGNVTIRMNPLEP